jgi:hypothetical protein
VASPVALLLAQLVLTVPYTVRLVLPDRSAERAAAGLGGPPPKVFWHVTAAGAHLQQLAGQLRPGSDRGRPADGAVRGGGGGRHRAHRGRGAGSSGRKRGEHRAAAAGMGYNGHMAENPNNELSALQPGQIETKDNGERFGRSAGGCLVQLRRRVSEPGFVVTVDAEPRPGVPTELISHEWAAANAAFDRFMHEY